MIQNISNLLILLLIIIIVVRLYFIKKNSKENFSSKSDIIKIIAFVFAGICLVLFLSIFIIVNTGININFDFGIVKLFNRVAHNILT